MAPRVRPPAERFVAYVGEEDPQTGCWPWLGAILRNGYGRFSLSHRKGGSAHRFAYSGWVGPIPEGMQVHHECRNRRCVNPSHLRLVTHRENLMLDDTPARRNALKAQCPQGHPYDKTNTYLTKTGGRACRECKRRSTRQWYHERGGKDWHARRFQERSRK